MHTRNSAETQRRILEVAETQFARKGYAGAHLQSIAEEVGVQKTALYYYYPSKAAIYLAVLSQILEEVQERLSNAADNDLPYAERLTLLLDEMNSLFCDARLRPDGRTGWAGRPRTPGHRPPVYRCHRQRLR